MRTVPNSEPQFSSVQRTDATTFKNPNNTNNNSIKNNNILNLRLFLFAQSPPPPANMFSLKFYPFVPLYGELETSRPCVTAATFLAVVMVWAWKKRDILMKKQFFPHSHAVTSLHQGFTVSLRLGGCFI